MEKEIIAEISLEGNRLYLTHKRKGNPLSKTDVTSVYYFCKGMLESTPEIEQITPVSEKGSVEEVPLDVQWAHQEGLV